MRLTSSPGIPTVTWSQKKKLTDEDGEAGDWFGYSVAVDTAAHTALVGAGSAHVLDIHDWESVPGIEGQLPTEHTVENLFNGRVYDFQVRAVNLRSPGPQAEGEAIPQANRPPVANDDNVHDCRGFCRCHQGVEQRHRR